MEEIEKWTMAVNEVVNILKCELDGGFLEDTKKYDGDTEELIYSCLRAVAVQIVTSPKLAIVDRDAELPKGVFDYEQHKRIFREAGWVKEIK